MNPEPFSFQYPVGDFDLSNVPIDAELLRGNPEMLTSAIQSFYEEFFRELGGRATVLVTDETVAVSWYPGSGDAVEQVSNFVSGLLNNGNYSPAEPLLRALLARHPNHTDSLLNLGMMLSDQNRFDEAIEFLGRLVEVDPENVHGWTALGVAHARQNNLQEAVNSLQRALEIDPDNAYALKNVGALLLKQSPDDALPFLERAALMLPNDQSAQYGHAQCLLMLGQTNADELFERVIELNPLSEIAELARTARRDIASKTLHSNVGGMPRPDAVMYCLDGLQKFHAMGKEKMRGVVYEIAMLGRNGLDINDPGKRYSLKSLPGDFSGLHLVSLMYTGIQLMHPSEDAGIDLSREYEEALREYNSASSN
jgi:tetratricopeptide (TPR) repeat protein